MTPDELFIFAAGFGTRMGALTQSVPKPLLTVAGRTLFDRTVDHARSAGIRRIAANAHHLAEQVEAHATPEGIEVFREIPDILDTGGGLKNAAPFFEGDAVFTANPDVVWAGPNPFNVLLDHWRSDLDALLLCVPVERAIGRDAGDFHSTDTGKLGRGGPLVYGGVQAIRLGPVTDVAERVFSLNLVWDHLAEDGKIAAATYPGHWCDVGTPEGLTRAEALLGEFGDA